MKQRFNNVTLMQSNYKINMNFATYLLNIVKSKTVITLLGGLGLVISFLYLSVGPSHPCSCFSSNLIVFLLTLIVGAIGIAYLVYEYRTIIFEKAKAALITGLRDVTYGVSDVLLSAISPVIDNEPVVLKADVEIRINNQLSKHSKHWMRYDPALDELCRTKNAILYAVMESTGERVVIPYNGGLEMNIYAREIDSSYSHFVVNINGEETVLGMQELVSWRVLLENNTHRPHSSQQSIADNGRVVDLDTDEMS